ncbi:MAG: diguanylate cyclase [Actinobacteria bacterium]|nr:diguanylate cyclase [Actinomycetota bacterium]
MTDPPPSPPPAARPTTVTADPPADLAATLDRLERHRSSDVEGRLRDARAAEQEALEAGWLLGAMRARLVVADMLHRVGSAVEGAALAVEVNNWAAANGTRLLLARTHLVLSSVFESIGDVASALDHAVRAIDLLGDGGTARDRGNYLLRLADATAVNGAGERDQARRRYREAEEIYVALGDRERHRTVLNNLAMLEYEAGDVPRALEVVAALREVGGEEGIDASLSDTIARVLLAAEDLAGAEQMARQGYRLLAERGNAQAVTPAELALTLAEILLAQGRLEAAQQELDRCIVVCRERDLGGVRVQALRVRAEILAARGLYEDAYRAHRFFHGEAVVLRSRQQEAAARTRQALFETAEARRAAQRFWEQARTDPLTDLYNRRFVDEELPHYLKEAATRGVLLVAAVVDADHFKRVNDTFSHTVGDQVLRRVGAILAATVGGVGTGPDDVPPGFAARLGGEEFLVVQVVADPRVGLRRIEAVRRAVESERWDDLAPGLGVTVSAGVTVAQTDDTQSSLLARADSHLYRAKSAGRNRSATDEDLVTGAALTP